MFMIEEEVERFLLGGLGNLFSPIAQTTVRAILSPTAVFPAGMEDGTERLPILASIPFLLLR